MALVKGYCKKCQIFGEEPKFFEVNTANEITYCPRCGNKMVMETAVNNYEDLFIHYLKEAEVLLFRCRDYETSYKAYGRIIDLDPENYIARYGRILSLVYFSTLRKPLINEALWIFSAEKTKFLRKNKDGKIYLIFLTYLNNALNKYRSSLIRRLSFHGYFYDTNCVAIFFERIVMIKDFKDAILEELLLLNKKKDNRDVEKFIQQLEEDVKELNNDIDRPVVDVDGIPHKFVKLNRNDKTIISHGDEKRIVKLPPFKRYYIRDDSKNNSLIDDKIFRKKNFAYIISKKTPAIFFALLGLSIISYVLSACVPAVKSAFFIVGTVSISLAAFFAIFHGVWNLICRFGESYFIIKPFKRK